MEDAPRTVLPSVDASVLLVDDAPANLLALEAVLQPLGCELVRASSGEDALRQLLRTEFAVVLMDVLMPGLDGLETAALIKSRPGTRHTPIIFLTGLDFDSNHLARGYARGAVDYIVKPYDPEILRAKVSVFVELFLKRQELKLQAELLRRREREAIESRRLYEVERGARAEAEAAAQARADILAVVSHDLRNPMTAISTSAAIVIRKIDRGAVEDTRKHLHTIQRAVDSMNRLVSDLLDVSRIEAGKLPLDKRMYDIADVVNQAVELLRPVAHAKAQELSVELGDADGLEVECDRERVQQILSNLLGNAIKFTPEGGQTTVSLERRAATVQLAVKDNGPGISPEHLPHLFDRYWQSAENRRAGIGLGLTIVKGIVQAHQGEVWVESEIGSGSRFCFTLPTGGKTVDGAS
jgi:signal transduction histidine kinase